MMYYCTLAIANPLRCVILEPPFMCASLISALVLVPFLAASISFKFLVTNCSHHIQILRLL